MKKVFTPLVLLFIYCFLFTSTTHAQSYNCVASEIVNGGFESNLDDWFTQGTNSITSDAHSGANAFTQNSTGGAGQHEVAATEGDLFTVTVYAKKTYDAEAVVGIKYLDNNGTQLAVTHIPVTSTSYELYFTTLAAPENTTEVEVFIWKANEDGSATADDFCLEKWSAPTPTCVGASCDIEPSFNNYVLAFSEIQGGGHWLDYDKGDLVLCDNEDGTLSFKGTVINGRDSDWSYLQANPCGPKDGWIVDITFFDRLSWDDFQGDYVQQTGCEEERFNWDYWDMTGTMTGLGCNAGRVVNITGPSNNYKMQIGWGGNSQSCEFGLSTWFAGEENGNVVHGDIYAHIDSACYYAMVPTVSIKGAAVSNCIDQPLTDIATVTLDIAWTKAPSDTIVIEYGNKIEYLDISGLSSFTTFEFNVPADNTIDNEVAISFYNSNITAAIQYNAPAPCSSNSISCEVLYISGGNKQDDGQPWDLGIIDYLNTNNGFADVKQAFAKSDASGYGLYDPNNLNSLLAIDLSDFDLVVVSPTANWQMTSDLKDDLASYEGGILNMSRDISDELGMTDGNSWVNVKNYAYIDNTTSTVLYNYDNINASYDELISVSDYNTGADAFLWSGAWNQSSEVNGVFYHFESTDVLPGITSHGPRTYLGYFMEGFYSNQANGGALPAPVSNWFNPTTDLTTDGKYYFDQAIILASEGCACVEIINSGINGVNTVCAEESVLFTATPVADATYNWTFSGEATPTSSTNPSQVVSWDSTGIKTITLVVSKNGCSETYTQAINITEPVFADAGPNQSICRGSSVQIGGNPAGPAAATYLWTPNLFLNSNSVANPVATPPITTTYTLTVTLNGCVRTEQVTVTVDVSLNPTVDAGPDKTINPGDTVLIGELADSTVVSFQWSTASGNIPNSDASFINVHPTVTTIYYVEAVNASGCSTLDSVRITVIPPTEICNNGIDDDNDGLTDCEDDDCDFVPGCLPDNVHGDPSIVAQRFDRWNFGDEVEIDFNEGLPEENSGSRLIAEESSGSFTGPNGEMLFYSDGKTIWNRNNEAMDNGEEIGGSDAVVNSSIAFQDPKNDHKMYMFFTASANDGNLDANDVVTNTANYAKINIHANGGNGSVIEKNQLIQGTSEGLTSLPHANGRDIWVITADKNTSTIYTTLVNQQGVQNSVAQTIQLSMPNGFPQEINIVSNAQYNMLAIGCYYDEMLLLYDFNNVTGTISNLKEVSISERVYGLEFSPNGMFLYVSSYGDQSLFQLKVNDAPANSLRAALSSAQILASRINISTGLGSYGQIQIGPDGRIYCPIAGVSLGAIVNPNAEGVNAGWSSSIIDIPGARITGALPNHMNGGCFRTSFLLPVELAHFNVVAEDADAFLDWATFSELNNDFFLVERSKDAINWTSITTIDGKGTSTDYNSYEYIDENLAAGIYYYRLKQVDFDGEFDYSEMRSIQITATSTEVNKSFTVFPNPVHAKGNISVDGINGSENTVRIIGSDGKEIAVDVMINNSYSLESLNLKAGFYILLVEGETEIHQQSIVVFE